MSNMIKADAVTSEVVFVNTTVKILAIFTLILAGMSMFSSITFWGVPMQGEAREATYWLGYSTLMLMMTLIMSMFSMYLWVEATQVHTTVLVDTTQPVPMGTTSTCTTSKCEFIAPYVVSQPLCDDCWFAKQVALSEAEDALLAEAYLHEDLEYVDCGYCSTPTANNSGVCTLCTNNPKWSYQRDTEYYRP